MAVYVDQLTFHGLKHEEKEIPSCHLFCDDGDEKEMHGIAEKMGMSIEWVRSNHYGVRHFILTRKRREQAIEYGAIAMDWEDAADFFRNARKDFIHMFDN